MSTQQIMKDIVKASNLSLETIASRMGAKRATNVSEMLRVQNMRVDNMVRILNACGYKLVIQSEEKGGKEIEVKID